MNNFIASFITVTVGPIVVLFIYFNFLAGIIGSIWLLVLGDWQAVIQCWLYGLFGYFIIGFAFMPSALISLVGIYLLELDNILGKILSIIPLLIVNILSIIIISAWCLLMTKEVVDSYYTVSNEIPLLFLCLAMVTGPLKELTAKEGPDASTSIVITLAAQIGMSLYVILSLFGAYQYILYAFFGTMGVLFLYQLLQSLSIIYRWKDLKDEF